MADRAEKLRVMDLLRKAGLWAEADKFREQARQRLRAQGRGKGEAKEAAWGEMTQKYPLLAEQVKPASPPRLAPIDLDPDYAERANAAQIVSDAILWAAIHRREIVVHGKSGLHVKPSRASVKPPSQLAVDLAVFYINHPEKLGSLYSRMMLRVIPKLAVKPEPATHAARAVWLPGTLLARTKDNRGDDRRRRLPHWVPAAYPDLWPS